MNADTENLQQLPGYMDALAAVMHDPDPRVAEGAGELRKNINILIPPEK